MTKWKALAILFSLFSLGAIRETYRIFTSPTPDNPNDRLLLQVIGVAFVILFIYLAIRFGKKASDNRLY